ncbi:MAG: DUF4912 domain-containing protein [Candidatus Omnitrophica bacterium]|nr:DUF4912 domain-containing protein [Candidatus Omnitrophota bacterium]
MKRAKKPSKSSKSLSRKTVKSVRRTIRKVRKKSVPSSPPVPPSYGSNDGAEEKSLPPASFDLPSRYHEDKLVLLARDPWWIFAYWEITPARESEVIRQVQEEGAGDGRKVLRVYDVTGKTLPAFHSFFDIETNPFADNWYVDVGKPDREWVAELGIRSGGRFWMLVRSNVVRTPRYGVSDVLDEEWMLPEELYAKLFGWSLGLGSLKSSITFQEMLRRYLRGLVSSEGISSAGLRSQAQEKHPYWAATHS